jgi:hypothetical protein
MKSSDPRLRYLRAYATAYLDQASDMTYADLRTRQEGPFANLAHGAAGIAYFFWRAAKTTRTPVHLDAAERWLDAADHAPSRDFWLDELRTPQLKYSLPYGPDGIILVRILLGHSRGKVDEQSVTAFQSRCRTLSRAPCEFMFGATGYLDGARVLYGETGDERFRAAADDVVAGLARRQASWNYGNTLAFAHGRAGILHALLRWLKIRSLSTRAPALRQYVTESLPAWLERLASEVAARRTLPRPRASMGLTRSWCNGAAGMGLLWAAAYAWERNAKYLRRARAVGRLLLSRAPSIGDLCCGYAGHSYAFLALDTLEPGKGWRDEAIDAAARGTQAQSRWPNSVLKGNAGLALLAWDLLRPSVLGFPFLDG